jgi:hypothetical protein
MLRREAECVNSLPMKLRLFWFCVFLCGALAYAKDPPSQVIVWPEQGSPILRFTFGKFREVGSLGNAHTYMIDTIAENLWTKKIANANFALYLFDKNKVRIADATITINDVAPGESIKFQTTISASGPPASLAVSPRFLPKELGPAAPPRVVSITINTVPQGAVTKLDGVEVGITPKIVQVVVGKHTLEFNKEGFNPGRFPFELGSDDASGGSVSFELGTTAHDTIELRDGSVLSGDVVSISGMEVVVKVGGSDQRLDRNQVKRILFVQRQPAE